MEKDGRQGKVLIVGICGRSKSGKSTLAESLAKAYKADRIEVDHYLRSKHKIPFKGKFRNWELPSNYRLGKLAKDLKKLKNGKNVNHPIYKFRRGRREGYREIKPQRIIFVESYYLFTNKPVRDLLDIKIFLDISNREFLKRVHSTPENEEWTQKEYLNQVVIPEYEKHGKDQKKYADFVFNGTLPKGELKKKVEMIINKKLK